MPSLLDRLTGSCLIQVTIFSAVCSCLNTSDQSTQRLDLAGRVLLLYNQTIDVSQVLAVNVRLVAEKSVLVQIWQHEGNTTYRLLWQQEVPSADSNLKYMERINYTLNVDEPFRPVLEDHRLGIYVIEDPIPLPVMVTNDNKGRVVLSPPVGPVPVTMNPGLTRLNFSKLTFPYYVPSEYLRLCDDLDCGLNVSKQFTAQPSKMTRPSTPVAVVGEGNFLLTLPFLTAVFAWLIILTLLMLVVLCIVVCFVFGKREEKTSDEPSEAQDQVEWFIVTDDPPESSSCTAQSLSTNICPTSRRHSTLAFENTFTDINI